MSQNGDALDFLAQANSVKTRYIQAVSDAYQMLQAVEDVVDHLKSSFSELLPV
jgi:hypothetical protein